MEKLPTEILCQILSQLDPPHAPLASVNQRWRDIMERKIWSTIKITMEELDDFRRSFHANTLRRQNLRHVHITLTGYFENVVDEVSHEQGDSSSDKDEELKDTECGLEGSEQDIVIRTEDDEFNEEAKNDEDCENLDVYLGAETSSDVEDEDFDKQDGNDNSDGNNEKGCDSNDENNSENEEDNSYEGSDEGSDEGTDERTDEGTDEGTDEETDEETNEEHDEEDEESSSERENNEGNWMNNQKRMSAFRDEHSRFFRETKSIWIVLSSWGKDFKVIGIEINIKGESIYELLGPFFRKPVLAEECLSPDIWSYERNLAGMPNLPSVTKLNVWADNEIDIWPAIVACQIVQTLPNALDLIIASNDGVKLWRYARRGFRNLLAKELLNLPTALQYVQLSLDYERNINEKVKPPHFLTNGTDTLSRALGHLSTQLTSLAINLSHLSPDLFWDPTIPFPASTKPVLWPSLFHFHIVTGLETSAGEYSMRGADRSFPYPPISLQASHEWESDSDDWDDEDRLRHELGNEPIYGFRIRPKTAYFNTLAISIARAAACMPNLAALSLEMLPFFCENNCWGDYHGWGFHFRSGSDTKAVRGNLDYVYRDTPMDSIELERPRTEWVFECPYLQVQWEEPEEAKALWQEKFADVDFDVMTMEYDEDTERRVWERRKNGILLEIIAR